MKLQQIKNNIKGTGNLMENVKHEKWSSGFIFLLAAVGSAVGLGNIWRFPYVVAENGGGAFVLLYLGIVILLGIPLLMTELSIGRMTGKAPINAFDQMVKENDVKAKPLWTALGWSYMLVPLGILCFYFVVAGWTLNYVTGMVMGDFNGITAEGAQESFGAMLGNWKTLIFWMTITLLITIGIVSQGIKEGLEKAVKILMPALFVIMVALVIYSSVTGEFLESVKFMFTPDFSKITGKTIMMAAGQAFFSLSLGSAAMMMYGAYLTKDISIPKMACGVALADTSVAILAGFMIFPIVFAHGMANASGPGLVFEVLPVIFTDMPMGQLFGVLFFLLLAFAAVTSTISLLEPMVALLEAKGYKRLPSAFIVGGGVWLIGVICALSLNVLQDVRLLGGVEALKDKNIMDIVEYFAANVFVPLNGLFVAIFIGWMVKRSTMIDEFNMGDNIVFKAWKFLVCYIVPIVMIAVFYDAAIGF